MKSFQAFNDRFKAHTGQTFKSKKFVEDALTHDSLGDLGKAFERLEFLGDGCVEMIIAELLVSRTHFSEGQMSQLRSSLTSKGSLARRFRQWKINPWIKLGKALDEKNLPDTVCADFFESLIGALYLDRGFDAMKKAIDTIFKEDIDKALCSDGNFANSKTKLQEWTMQRKLDLPKYQVEQRTGPAHQPLYRVSVEVAQEKFFTVASSIKRAEFKVAECALEHLKQKLDG